LLVVVVFVSVVSTKGAALPSLRLASNRPAALHTPTYILNVRAVGSAGAVTWNPLLSPVTKTPVVVLAAAVGVPSDHKYEVGLLPYCWI
jgi:hypothetical protein